MKYRKKPVVIEAMQVLGHNDAEIGRFVGDSGYDPVDMAPSWILHTLEGDMKASLGDFIIKGVAGEFYPCKPDIFAATYEPLDVDGPHVSEEGDHHNHDDPDIDHTHEKGPE